MIKFKAGSAEETTGLGEKLGRLLQKGDTVCLTGELGTGKTAFTGGIARALEIEGYITSPTFTIVNEYHEGRVPLYHFDVYRIGSPEEMYEIGFEEYLAGDGVVIIEWAELIESILPEQYISVKIERDEKNLQDGRWITFDFKGPRYKGYDEKFEAELQAEI